MTGFLLETYHQMDKRLREVMKLADLEVFTNTFRFVEFEDCDFAEFVRKDALAIVRDETRWSQLVPAEELQGKLFQVLQLHFPEEVDRGGLVGWVGTHLRRSIGTDIIVICGQNSRAGGTFDYIGYPVSVASKVRAEIRNLMT
ncbi:hypothetical protein ASD03_32365 [Ensifer sp. Root127]|nr:hypothetical protein ASD03_32365 [Ensifer sp. Root127]